MIGLRSSTVILAVICSFSLNAAILAQGNPPVNPPNYQNGVYAKSWLRANGDGTVTAICSTSAVDPQSLVTTATNSLYNGFSTTCSISPELDTSNIITTPTNCYPAATQFGLMNKPTGDCQITFYVQPGTQYILTSKHFIWFLPASGPCPPSEGSNFVWSDPQDFADDWDNNFTGAGANGLGDDGE
jgi:hypothetical protein